MTESSSKRRQRGSAAMWLARTALSFAPGMRASADDLRAKVAGRQYPDAAPLPASLRARCEVEEVAIDGQRIITLTPRSGPSRWHIIYLHGGAYINPLVAAHWSIVAALIRATGASVTVPLYALAPESDDHRGSKLVDAVYDRLEGRHPHARIVLAGDSAGGNFALNVALRRRDAGLSPPDRLILFSPWLDLTLRDARAAAMEAQDVMLRADGLRLCGKWWAGDLEPASPELSPLYASLDGLPPIAMYQGDRDIFVIDARTLKERCDRAAVECRYLKYPGAFHVFMAGTFLPEAHDVYREVGSLLKDSPLPLVASTGFGGECGD